MSRHIIYPNKPLFVPIIRLLFLILIINMLDGHASSAQSATSIYLVKDINLFSMGTLNYGSDIGSSAVMNNILYFTAFNGLDFGLWRSDGTTTGTHAVLEGDAENGFVGGSHFMVVDDLLLFIGYTVTAGELWRSDGSTEGTFLLKDINPGVDGSMVRCPLPNCRYPSFATLDEQLIFSAYEGEHGFELWHSDGTSEGTMLLMDIYPGRVDSVPRSFLTINNTLFFTADDGVHGHELWRSDGTTAGTFMVKDIYSGTVGSHPYEFFQFQNTLYFAAETADAGIELWRSDGTEAGTTLVADINSGPAPSGPRSFIDCHNQLFFTVSLNTGAYLWVTDGTNDGTQPFTQEPVAGIVTMEPQRCVDNLLYLLATNEQNIYELWTSDGTITGTVPLDSNPEAYTFRDFALLGNQLFFVHSDDTHGYEPWLSNGTVEGTRLLQDVAVGTFNSNARIIAQSTALVYLVADDGTTGEELWAMPLPQQHVYLPSVIGE